MVCLHINFYLQFKNLLVHEFSHLFIVTNKCGHYFNNYPYHVDLIPQLLSSFMIINFSSFTLTLSLPYF